MAAPEKDTSALFLSGSVVLIAALGGYLWYQAPLKSARPANPGLERHETATAKRALARLWQDPLAAVDEHRKTSQTKGASADKQGWQTLADEIAQQLHAGRSVPGTAVFFVMTDGSPYVEGTEQRIRDRYAVGSALSVACYVPEDGDHVGYVLTGNDPPIPLPFEWYSPRALRDCAPDAPTPTLYERVLVLWLSDEIIGDGPPLKILSRLTNDLHTLVHDRYRARNPSSPTMPAISFNLIGPSSSSMLRDMVAEADGSDELIHWPPIPATGQQGALPVYSPSATVSSQVMTQSLQGLHSGASLETDRWVRDTLGKAGVTLPYRIPSDFELSQSLLRELDLRGVRHGSHIALLAEWDSFYGRTLPSEFVAAACVRAHSSVDDSPCSSHGKALEALANPAAQQQLIPWIRQYSFLRGLDGELPGGESGGKGGRGKSILGKAGNQTLDDLERPEGEGQLDYVRRLADRLEADSENREFRAIGILGSDVYDKLLILQALRKRFPHTLFFTTDLDARLLHPSQYEWTHNLIVSSHFGLQVHPALQQAIPPFRSCYQSATFVAVLQSVGHLRQESPGRPYTILGDSSIAFEPTSLPLIYELGRTTADLLPTTRESDRNPPNGVLAGSWHERLNSPVSSVAETFARQQSRLRFLLIGLAVLCAMYLAIPVIRSVPEEMLSVDTGNFIVRTSVALMIFLGSTVALFHWLGGRPDAEPFYWMEGISLWPSELIRLTTALLCFGFLRFAHTLLTTNAERLTAEYDLHDSSPPSTMPQASAGWTRFLSPTAWSIDFTGKPHRVSELWQEHGRYVRTTWQRVIPQAIMLGILGMVLLFSLGPPHPPARGLVALVWHHIAWGLATILTGLLIFYVVDAIRVCTGFIHQFSLEPTRWSPAVVQPLSERRKVPADLVGEWLDIRFIADRTKVVSSLIHYPLITLFLMIIARHRIFDDWSYPPGLLLLYGVSAAYILICAVLLSVAAEKARRTAVTRLRDHLYELRGRAQEPGQGDRSLQQIAQIDLMLQDIQGTQQGAFAHWTQHPVFKALLLPSGGFSVLALLDYFLTQ